MSEQTVYVAYMMLDENYGPPAAVFSTKEKLDAWMATHKDWWGEDYYAHSFVVDDPDD